MNNSSRDREEPIDIGKLTQRELLITLVRDMDTVKKDIEQKSATDLKIHLRLATLEMKVKMYAAGGAAVVTLLIKGMEYLLK